MSSDTALNRTNIGLGTTIGLIVGPLIGYLLIQILKGGYLETRFAIQCIFLGDVIGIVIGVIAIKQLKNVESIISRSNVLLLLIFGIIVSFAELVIMIRIIIP